MTSPDLIFVYIDTIFYTFYGIFRPVQTVFLSEIPENDNQIKITRAGFFVHFFIRWFLLRFILVFLFSCKWCSYWRHCRSSTVMFCLFKIKHTSIWNDFQKTKHIKTSKWHTTGCVRSWIESPFTTAMKRKIFQYSQIIKNTVSSKNLPTLFHWINLSQIRFKYLK